MAGNPFNQVQQALRHIVAVAADNNMTIELILYDSSARVIALPAGSLEEKLGVIDSLRAGGGTMFTSAIRSIGSVLAEAQQDMVDPQEQRQAVASVVFLSDGCDGSGVGADRLVAMYAETLREAWAGTVVTHSLGFSAACNRTLLEDMRKSGSEPGVFQYAEPGDDGDALAAKLSGIFDLATANANRVKVHIEADGGRTVETELVVRRGRAARGQFWLDGPVQTLRVRLDGDSCSGVEVPVTLATSGLEAAREQFLAKKTDTIATDLLALARDQPAGRLLKLRCDLLRQRTREISILHAQPSDKDPLAVRLAFLNSQIDALSAGQQVSQGRLCDLQYASLFSPPKDSSAKLVRPTHIPATRHSQAAAAAAAALDCRPAFERPLKRYSRNSDHDNSRNELMRAICSTQTPAQAQAHIASMEAAVTAEMLTHTDNDGNNSLMLAAFCGHELFVRWILQQNKRLGRPLDLGLANDDGETAVTLCIKKRGFHRTLGLLLDAGACIPGLRRRALERFAIENGFRLTANIIARAAVDLTVDVDDTMDASYIRFTFERACEAGKLDEVLADGTTRAQQFLDVVLAKMAAGAGAGVVDGLLDELLDKRGAQPTIDMLLQRCFPPKPDHPETERYLDLARRLVSHDEGLVKASNAKGETALFTAALRGSLPHVQYFLRMGAEVDAKNWRGNTALWVAAHQCYPCIVSELILSSADVNCANLKGNPPLYGACDRGSAKVARLLLEAGADVEVLNDNGDSLLLICCRNGQAEVLALLLDFASSQLVAHVAHIDGFGVVHAAVEANKPACLRVLAEDGQVDLNVRTRSENAILANATPLMLAAYYNRIEACAELLVLGADTAAADAQGATALHVAVAQSHGKIVEMLLQHKPSLLEVRDRDGQTALAFARDVAVRRLLTDPGLDSLTLLCCGGFDEPGEEAEACRWVAQHRGVAGGSLVNVRDEFGVPVLLMAVVHSRRAVVAALLEAGADIALGNGDGLRCSTVARATRNRRIQELLRGSEDQGQLEAVAALKTLAFLSPKAGWSLAPAVSTLPVRMQSYINAVRYVGGAGGGGPALGPLALCDDFGGKAPFISGLADKDVFQARLLALSKVATGKVEARAEDFVECAAVALFTSNPREIAGANEALLSEQLADKPFLGVLYRAVEKAPVFAGEVFVGAPELERRQFGIGQKFYWPTFVCASTVWRMALLSQPGFDSKGATAAASRKGTVLLLKSKSGRLVGGASMRPADGEVVFLPRTRFRVVNWYHGSVIALGQANVRAHSFQVKDKDDERQGQSMADMMQSDKSLIIEMEEME